MTNDIASMFALAKEFHDSAVANRAAGRCSVAFENARHAAEVAGKILLYRSTRSFPAKHTIAGDMAAAGVVPMALDLRSLHRLMAGHTRGRYGYSAVPSDEEVADAIEVADLLLRAAKNWPEGNYWPGLEAD